MLRAAASRGPQLAQLAKQLAQSGTASRAVSSAASGAEGSSVASLISAVKASSSGSFAAGGLSSLKAGVLQPHYPAAAAPGLSTQAKLVLGAAAAWFLYRADTQARSHEWIVDLSLNVLQAAWLVSFLSFLPFRGVYMSMRAMAPHTAGPLQALKPTAFLK